MAGRQKKKELLTVLNIRENNKRNLLAQLMGAAELTRNDLARESKISLMTVKHIVDELIENGIVEERTSEATVGRKPKALSISARYGNIVCINLTSTDSISYIIYDIRRQLLAQNTLAVRPGILEYHSALKTVAAEIREKLKKFSTVTVGVAACVPSAYYEDEDLVNYDLIPAFQDFHIKGFLKEEFGLDNVLVLHDVFSAAKSEYESSVPVPESQLYLYFGHGVGGCMMVQGNAVEGEDLLAGEIGKMLEPNPFTGEYQTLEEIVSVRGILERVHEIRPGMDFEEVLLAYRNGEKEIAAVLDNILNTAARVLYNLVWLYNPTRFVVDSCYEDYRCLIREKAEAFISRVRREEIQITVRIEVAKYDEYHMMRGCFRMAREKWLDLLSSEAPAGTEKGALDPDSRKMEKG